MIVAIDGLAGSGKSSTARAVARQMGYYFLGTGAMYRGVAFAFLRCGCPLTDENVRAVVASLVLDVTWEAGVSRITLQGEDVTGQLAHPDVSSMSSTLARFEAVRTALVAQQREKGNRYRNNPGIVLEGRDIGTIVFPDADVKIYMQADIAVRARRRQDEFMRKGRTVAYSDVLEDLVRRDKQDKQRKLSPLRLAADAIIVDTTERSFDNQVAFIVDRVRERSP